MKEINFIVWLKLYGLEILKCVQNYNIIVRTLKNLPLVTIPPCLIKLAAVVT
jgi:hypothetical protein